VIQLVNVATSTKETIMSQTAKQNPAPKHTPMSEQTRQEAPVTGVSPDDPFPVPSDETGKPGAPLK
jgi:hypothetical protein